MEAGLRTIGIERGVALRLGLPAVLADPKFVKLTMAAFFEAGQARRKGDRRVLLQPRRLPHVVSWLRQQGRPEHATLVEGFFPTLHAYMTLAAGGASVTRPMLSVHRPTQAPDGLAAQMWAAGQLQTEPLRQQQQQQQASVAAEQAFHGDARPQHNDTARHMIQLAFAPEQQGRKEASALRIRERSAPVIVVTLDGRGQASLVVPRGYLAIGSRWEHRGSYPSHGCTAIADEDRRAAPHRAPERLAGALRCVRQHLERRAQGDTPLPLPPSLPAGHGCWLPPDAFAAGFDAYLPEPESMSQGTGGEALRACGGEGACIGEGIGEGTRVPCVLFFRRLQRLSGSAVEHGCSMPPPRCWVPPNPTHRPCWLP